MSYHCSFIGQSFVNKILYYVESLKTVTIMYIVVVNHAVCDTNHLIKTKILKKKKKLNLEIPMVL